MPFIFPILSTAPANTEAEEVASIPLAHAAPLSGRNSSGGRVLFPPKPARRDKQCAQGYFFSFFGQAALFMWRRVWLHPLTPPVRRIDPKVTRTKHARQRQGWELFVKFISPPFPRTSLCCGVAAICTRLLLPCVRCSTIAASRHSLTRWVYIPLTSSEQMDATLGRAGADESVGEEDGLEDGKERKQQSDGSLALQQICALLRRNAIVSYGTVVSCTLRTIGGYYQAWVRLWGLKERYDILNCAVPLLVFRRTPEYYKYRVRTASRGIFLLYVVLLLNTRIPGCWYGWYDEKAAKANMADSTYDRPPCCAA